MTERNVAEIRAYLAHNEDTDMPMHDYAAMLEEDMRRLLDAGVKLRAALLDAIALADQKAYDLGDIIQKRHETLIVGTAWLAEPEPAPAQSPDGENEEGEA